MDQKIECENYVDKGKNPTGGFVTAVGIDIKWQDGPLGRGEDRKKPNGAFVEGVIRAALTRLAFYQLSKFKCRENAMAITKLEEALHWCNHRTQNREFRKVEGLHEV